MSFITDRYQKELNQLCKTFKVDALHLFGSFANGTASAKSDMDFLGSFKDMSIEEYTDSYFDLHEALEKLFGRPIDLVTVNSLSNPYFIESVERTKQLLYAA